MNTPYRKAPTNGEDRTVVLYETGKPGLLAVFSHPPECARKSSWAGMMKDTARISFRMCYSLALEGSNQTSGRGAGHRPGFTETENSVSTVDSQWIGMWVCIRPGIIHHGHNGISIYSSSSEIRNLIAPPTNVIPAPTQPPTLLTNHAESAISKLANRFLAPN